MGIHLLPFIPTDFLWGYTSCHLSPQIFYGDTPLAIYPHRFSMGILLLPLSPQTFYGDTPLAIYPHRLYMGILILPFILTDFLWGYTSCHLSPHTFHGNSSPAKRLEEENTDSCLILKDQAWTVSWTTALCRWINHLYHTIIFYPYRQKYSLMHANITNLSLNIYKKRPCAV